MTDWKKAAEKAVKEGRIPSDAKADLVAKSKHLLLFTLGVIAVFIGILFAIGMAIGVYNSATGGKTASKLIPETPAAQASAPAVQATASTPPQAPPEASCDTAKAEVARITHDGPYAQVRAKLIAAGWVPKSHSKPPVMADGTEDFATKPAWDAGFREVDSCAGAGIAPCTYRFADQHGNSLAVVGIGEDPPSQQIDSAKVTCSGERGKSHREVEPANMSPQSNTTRGLSQADGADKIGRIVSALSPDRWARCVAGDTTVLALIARGDPVPESTLGEHKAIGPILGAVRSRMLLKHIPAAALDSMVRGYSIQIRSASDPFVAAFQIVDDCTGDIAKAAQ